MLHVLVLEDDEISRDALCSILKTLSENVNVCAVSSLKRGRRGVRERGMV